MGRIHEIWRDCALQNKTQFYGIIDDITFHKPRGFYQINDGTPVTDLLTFAQDIRDNKIHCAYSAVVHQLDIFTFFKHMKWTCPDCGITKYAPISDWMIHLNNTHQWDWLQLANKFPEIDESFLT